ncbi:hypothetical protein FRB90_011055 [Tulasnella sp. 427]|nr:hypothetical protein FRB90_011055 [Tulasnella sp. 427]
MFTGPHGVTLKHGDWLPEFASFVVDGESTSRANEWAVGEEGKGFTLATQFFYETIEKTLSRLTSKVPRSFKAGLSFRVGHHNGELKWKKGRSEGESDVLMVTQDDLMPLNANGFMERRGLNSLDDSEEGTTLVTRSSSVLEVLKGVFKRRKTYGMSSSLLLVKEPSSPTHERNLIKADEIVITALGLPTVFAEDFYYTYGILPIKGSWQFPDSAFQLFDPQSDGPLSHLRDQFVLKSPPGNYLGINYHGKLVVSADRTAVSLRVEAFDAYRQAIESPDSAFRAGGSPELAHEIWIDILSDSVHSGASIGRVLVPQDASAGEAYREAFGKAWADFNRGIPASTQLWPYPKSSDDLKLINELKKNGCPVEDHVMKILEKSGAYCRIKDHAYQLLRQAPEITAERPGQSRLEQAINSLLSH